MEMCTINGTTYTAECRNGTILCFVDRELKFVIPKSAKINDFIRNDKVVVGCETVPLKDGGEAVLSAISKLLKSAETPENTGVPKP